MELVLVYVMVVVIFASLTMILDLCLAYFSQNKIRKLVIEKASLDKFTLGELKEFIKESGKPHAGIPGQAL